MKNNNLTLGLIIFAVTAVGFFGGMKYQQSKVPAAGVSRGQFGPDGNRAGGADFGNRGGAVIGEVLSIDDKTMVVKLPDGSSKIVLWNSATPIVKTTQTGATDIIVGERVSVFGQTNTDGSVTAQNIQLNPLMRNATPSGAIKK